MTARVQVLPGPGSIIRFGELVVWAGPQASTALLGFLAQSARNVAHAADSGRQVVDHVAGILASRDPEPGVPFGVVGPDRDGWALILHGPVQAWDGRRWLAPSPSPGWLRASVALEPAVTLGPAGSPAPRLDLTSPYDLGVGMVPGGGVIVVASPDGASRARPGVVAASAPLPDPTTALAPPPPSPAPAPAPPPASRAATVDLRHAVASGAALPLRAPRPPAGRPEVTGAVCERGHLAPPGTPRCPRCGRPAGGEQRGPRPSLGVLIADDGAVQRLSGDLLLGADPAGDPAVAANRLTAWALLDPAGALAPAHTEIRLDGWSVEVVDRGSAAGTYVMASGASDWERLDAFEPRTLEPGGHVALGRRVLTYLSPWTEPAAG